MLNDQDGHYKEFCCKISFLLSFVYYRIRLESMAYFQSLYRHLPKSINFLYITSTIFLLHPISTFSFDIYTYTWCYFYAHICIVCVYIQICARNQMQGRVALWVSAVAMTNIAKCFVQLATLATVLIICVGVLDIHH